MDILYNLRSAAQSEILAWHPGFHGKAFFPPLRRSSSGRLSLDLEATRRVIDALIRDGVSGLIVCGTVGENSLPDALGEDRHHGGGEGCGPRPRSGDRRHRRIHDRLRLPRWRGRPSGSASTASWSCRRSSIRRSRTRRRRISAASRKRPTCRSWSTTTRRSTRTTSRPTILASLADCETIVCFKDSSGDTRRFIDMRNMVGDRFVHVRRPRRRCGRERHGRRRRLGFGHVECLPARRRDPVPPRRAPAAIAEAMPLYEWFMPLLHLDARPDLVQCIKLCEHIMGRGTRPDPPAAPCA